MKANVSYVCCKLSATSAVEDKETPDRTVCLKTADTSKSHDALATNIVRKTASLNGSTWFDGTPACENLAATIQSFWVHIFK